MGLLDRFFKKNNGSTFPGGNVEEKVIQPEPVNENIDPNNTLIQPMTPENSVPLQPGQNLTVGTEETTFGINAPQFNSVEEIDKQFPVNDEAPKSEVSSITDFKPEVPTPAAPVAPVSEVQAPVIPAAPEEPVEAKPADVVEPKAEEPLLFGDATPVQKEENTVAPAPVEPSPIRLVTPDTPRPISPEDTQVQNSVPVQPSPIHLVGQPAPSAPAPDAPIFGDPLVNPGQVETLNETPNVQAPVNDTVHFPGVDQTDFNGETLDGGVTPQIK